MQFCAPAASDAELLATLQSIGADRFMGRDETGLDRGTGERGGQLSGGQRGFLTIARALASPSRLLFLDEPTGPMDTHGARLFKIGRAQVRTPATNAHPVCLRLPEQNKHTN